MKLEAIVHSRHLAALSFCIPEIHSVQNTFAALASFSSLQQDGTFSCYPKVSTIAERAQVSVRCIHYHLKKLVKLGIVKIIARYKKPLLKNNNQSRRLSSRYVINRFKIMTLLHRMRVRQPFAVKHCTLRSSPSGNKKNNGANARFLSVDKNTSAFNEARYKRINQEEALKAATRPKPEQFKEAGLSALANIRAKLNKIPRRK